MSLYKDSLGISNGERRLHGNFVIATDSDLSVMHLLKNSSTVQTIDFCTNRPVAYKLGNVNW